MARSRTHNRPGRRLAALLAAAALPAAITPAVAQPVAASVPAQLAPKAAQSLLLDIARAGSRLVAVGERGHVLLSDAGCGPWRQVAVPRDRLLTAVHFTDAQHGWAVGHEALVLATADGGESWQVQHDGAADAAPALLDVWFADAQRGWAVGAFGLLLHTRDGGAHWEDHSSQPGNPDGLHLNAVTGLADGRVLVAGERGLVLLSDATGNHWQPVPFPHECSLFGVVSTPARTLLFGLRGHAYASRDGHDWQPLAVPLPQTLSGGVASDDGRVFLAGEGGTVLTGRIDGNALQVLQADQGGHLTAVTLSAGSLCAVGQGGARRLATDAATAGGVQP